MNGAAGDEQTKTSMTALSDQGKENGLWLCPSCPPTVQSPLLIPYVVSLTDLWSQEDMLTLLETMKTILPSPDSAKYKTTESHLDWNKLAFKSYTGIMCRQKWMEISTVVRYGASYSSIYL